MENSNLDNHPEMEKLIGFLTDFNAVILLKGYRGKFRIIDKGPQPGQAQSLSRCLRHFLESYVAEEQKKSAFELETYAEYSHADDHIKCNFKVRLDPDKGFKVSEIIVSHQPSGGRKHYRLNSNHQTPGVFVVQGLFPKPKPWDNHLKGKFKL